MLNKCKERLALTAMRREETNFNSSGKSQTCMFCFMSNRIYKRWKILFAAICWLQKYQNAPIKQQRKVWKHSGDSCSWDNRSSCRRKQICVCWQLSFKVSNIALTTQHHISWTCAHCCSENIKVSNISSLPLLIPPAVRQLLWSGGNRRVTAQ